MKSLFLACLFLASGFASAEQYYCDPINGSKSGDGSLAKPWGTLESVISGKLINGEDNASGIVHAGDTINLLSGNHGQCLLTPPKYGKFANTSPITIQAVPQNVPILSVIDLRSDNSDKTKPVKRSKGWIFRGLTVQAGEIAQGFAVKMDADDVSFIENTIYSIPDATSWTPDDWTTKAAKQGVIITGAQHRIINNQIRNVRFGLTVNGSGLTMGNHIEYFSDDGLRFTSGNVTIRGNSVTDSYCLLDDLNHNDLMQGFLAAGLTLGENVIIEDNILIASTGKYKNLPLVRTGTGAQCTQGCSIFDGAWKNVVARGNTVITSAYHGLTFCGVENLTIENNVVMSSCSTPKITLWIAITDSKDHRPTVNAVVRNNVSTKYTMVGDVHSSNNYVLVPGLIPTITPLK